MALQIAAVCGIIRGIEKDIKALLPLKLSLAARKLRAPRNTQEGAK